MRKRTGERPRAEAPYVGRAYGEAMSSVRAATDIWFLDDEPCPRFPVYCRGNVGEIVPNAATPLTTTITVAAFRRAFGVLFTEAGAFSEDEIEHPAATGGLFGGYLYFNASFARTFAARAPGLRVADIDRQLLGAGADKVPPHRRGPGDRNPVTAVRALRGLVGMVARHTPSDLDAERRETVAWLQALPPEPSAAEVIDLAATYVERFERHLRSLLDASFGAGLPSAMLERIAGRAERKAPGLLVRAMSGLGTIETAQPAVALWRLGRSVAESESLTSAFDAGVVGLLERLRTSDDADAAGFVAAFDEFLTEHGHRGPNEVELASDTWATAPETALALVDRLRLTDAGADPQRAAERLASERDRARSQLRDGVPRPLRKLVDRLLESSAKGTARREQAKGTLVLGLSGMRMALFHLADALIAGGQIQKRSDLFMATVDELPQLVDDSAALTAALAERRRRYDELNALVPPFAFEGALPDPSTWPSRTAPYAPSGERLDTLDGIGVASGTARGAARVIVDPGDPRGIAPGEVLVAPHTDPAWTPLFLAAVAVVVDVGAMQSHAAIVARELGIPAVVSVDGASRRIADGDMVEVDGDRGVVRIMSRS